MPALEFGPPATMGDGDPLVSSCFGAGLGSGVSVSLAGEPARCSRAALGLCGFQPRGQLVGGDAQVPVASESQGSELARPDRTPDRHRVACRDVGGRSCGEERPPCRGRRHSPTGAVLHCCDYALLLWRFCASVDALRFVRYVRAVPPPPLPCNRPLQERALDARKIAAIVDDVETQEVAGATARDDAVRLRGLPAVSRYTSGAAFGTDPMRALLAKERWRR